MIESSVEQVNQSLGSEFHRVGVAMWNALFPRDLCSVQMVGTEG